MTEMADTLEWDSNITDNTQDSYVNIDQGSEQEIVSDSGELQDPFDVNNLTENLRSKSEEKQSGPEMAITTDKVLMYVQLSMFVLCVVAGLMVGLSLGWAVQVNMDNCPLYAKLDIIADLGNKTLQLREVPLWGSDSTCNYCTFSAVCIAIYAIIWTWFFVLTSDWDRQLAGIPPDVNLLLPALFCLSVFLVISFVSAGMVSAGYGTWCSYVENGITEDCSGARDFVWQNYPDANSTYYYFEWAVAGSWILVIALGAKVFVCAVRVKQHFHDIMKDEDDDLIDLYLPNLGSSYEVIQTPLPSTSQTEVWRKYATVNSPKNPPNYTPLGDLGSDEEGLFEDDHLNGDLKTVQVEHNKVDKDDFLLGASAIHPDGDSDVLVKKRRISRMDAINEEQEENHEDNSKIPKTMQGIQESSDDDDDSKSK